MLALHTLLAWTMGLLRIAAALWLLVIAGAGLAWVSRGVSALRDRRRHRKFRAELEP